MKPPTPLEKPSPAAPHPDNEPSWTQRTPLDRRKTRRSSISIVLERPAFSQSEREPLQTPTSTPAKKRPEPGAYDDTHALPPEPSSEPLSKRRRVSRSRYTLDHFNLAKSVQLLDGSQPISPLFFSNSRRSRPQLPARFSSSEAAARMLSKTRGEDGGIKTVKLARGTFSGLSPPGLTSGASGRSSERSSLPPTMSPDARDSDPLRLLGSVGIVELLEQDNRPTFIVDIGDQANYAPDARLQIIFANSALRSSPHMWELVAGKLPASLSDDPTMHASNQFKGWLLSTVIQGERLDVNPPPVEHGSMVWSCYTLRKRLRVVSAAPPWAAASSIPSTSASQEFGLPSSSSGPNFAMGVEASPVPVHEPQDYFGPTVPSVATTAEASDQDPTPLPENIVDMAEAEDDIASVVPFQRPSKLDLPLINGHPSFTNECVLRAQASADVDPFRRVPSPPAYQDGGFFDWTRLSLSPSLPRHIQFARSTDWASTPLGPIEFWSNDLRAMCNLIM